MATNALFPTVESRVKKAAEILSIPSDEFQKIVTDTLGVEPDEFGVQLLDADTTGEDFIYTSLGGVLLTGDKKYSELKLKAVAAILKGRDPFAKKEKESLTLSDSSKTGAFEVNPTAEGQALAGLINSLRTPQQMKDRELLESFSRDQEHGIEQELNKRAGGQHFVVLKDSAEKGKQEIDIEATLELLKRTRKMTVPSMLPHPSDPTKIIEVYRITQLNPEDNIVELCPFCDEIMYRGYCQKCDANFAGVGDDERAYVRLASELDSFEPRSKSDRRALLVDAMKGIAVLRQNWPGARIRFRELKLTGDLPKLRKLRTLPSVKPADPFGVRDR
jgi:hypothetical protein